MGVFIQDINITNQFTGTETNYLLGNIGDKVTIEVYFKAEESFVTGSEEGVDRIILAPQPYIVNATNSKDIIYCEYVGVFENYRVGDTLKLTTTATVYTVYEKLSTQAIRVYETAVGDVDFYADNGNAYDDIIGINNTIYLTTPLSAVNYRWNFVRNDVNDGFINPIDEQRNQAKASGLVNASGLKTMIFDVPVTNNYGTIQVEKLAQITQTTQIYRLVHETIITPFFLAGQENDLKNNIPPTDLDADSSLKYILSIDAGREANDPNFIQTVDFSALNGNVGWYGENFNGNESKFSVTDVRYKNQALETITSVELTDNVQTVEIDVYSQDGVFSNNNTEFDLTFFVLNQLVSDYQYNGKTIVENFYLDKAFNTVGSAAVAGDNNGTDYEIFNQVSANYVDANNITITAEIDLTANGIADLGLKGYDYFIGVSTQDHLKDTEQSDRVHLIADVQPFFINTVDDGMIVFEEVKILRHYESDFDTEGTATPIVRTEDDVLTYCKFYIDRTGRENDTISIGNISSQVVAKKTDGSEFVLESFEQSLSGSLLVDDSQYIDVSSERSFKMPSGEQRKTIATKRRIDLDTNDLRYYEVKYPFLMRWEYWKSKVGVDSDAFDINEPNNGQNENWHRYNTLADWNIYFRTRITATKNGESQSYQSDLLLDTYDYLEDTEWINETIETFDADTNAPLNGLIKNPCKVVISKEYSGLDVPLSADNVEWVMRIEAFEQGGINDIRFLSSVYDWSEQSWFKSVDGTGKVKKTKVGNVFTAEALIDFNKIPELQEYKISGRVYDENALEAIDNCYIVTEGVQPIVTEDVVNLVPESCDEEPPIIPSGKETENDELKITEDGQVKLPE